MWTEEIAELKERVVRLKRQRTRAMRRHEEEDEEKEVDREHVEAKRNLRKAIGRKSECWRDLCNKLEEDIWSDGYKIVTRELRLGHPKITLSRERKEEIVASLFPVAGVEICQIQGYKEERAVVEIGEEIKAAAERLRKKRAPGLD